MYLINEGIASKMLIINIMVAHTGFEPVVSSLRGKCPKPLDECAGLTAHEATV